MQWVLDGGASRHYTGNKELLHDIRKLDKPITTVTANGKSQFRLVGKVSMKTKGKTLLLNDVAYVPGFDVNLMSVTKIVDSGANVLYTKKKAEIQRKNGSAMLSIPRVGDLFIASAGEVAAAAISDSENENEKEERERRQ